MPRHPINDIELYYELTGAGDDAIVLVHGSWTDHVSWQLVAPAFAARHTVLTYDRRGHSRSVAPIGAPGTRRQHENDLAALIETLDLGMVTLVGNSYGGSIVLGLVSERPDLVRCAVVHEPPLLHVTHSDPGLGADLAEVDEVIGGVVELLQAGNTMRGVQLIVEHVLGPGAWQMIPDDTRRTFITNAATFVEMIADRAWAEVPTASAVPVLLTDGDASPSWLPGIVDALASTGYPQAARHTFTGAGHMPHLTHPADFVSAVESFAATSAGAPAAGQQ
jgi:pimeloyl-ACP methyl ester carboxylesterase